MLEIKDLKVSLADNGKEIIKGISLTIRDGEVHAIMGPNGSGKSTFAYSLAGHPSYQITGGKIILDGQDITEATPDVRAIAGLFLAQQLPTEVEGVSFSNFLRTSYNAVKQEEIGVREWIKKLQKSMDELKMDSSFMSRSLNVGFSGGEKKRSEILQLKLLEPKYAILDETDSGLDVDAIKIVAQGINDAKQSTNFGALLITHHTHLLETVKPDFVHVFVKGQIVKTGDYQLAKDLISQGYNQYL